jgi:predicted ATPase/class 3 adenylate cyclase/DNA-binding CsgD family transcriptional regulator
VASTGGARPSGTVAFLFTDIEDSTLGWELDPDAMRAAVGRHLELIDAVAARHDGARAVEQGAGDSTVLAFSRPSAAMAAALDAQRALLAEAWPTASPIRVRMALHLGEVDQGPDGTYQGPTLNRCGRLLAAAHGGQVLASDAFVQLVTDARADGAAWIDLGEHRLRGIEAPMRIHQLSGEGLMGDFPPLRFEEDAGPSVPVPPTPLVARSAELAELAGLVGSHRLVTITGAGGTGKTRLAIELANACPDMPVDEVTWVDLASTDDPQEVPAAVVAAMALRRGPDEPAARLIEHLRRRQHLLVVDNCEHLVEAVAGLVGTLLSTAPDLRILATSREPLGLGHEVVWHLDPLTTPVGGALDDVRASPAGELFLERVGRARAGQGLSVEDVAAAAAICRRVDGIPLALELAAARARTMPLPELATRLADRLSLLAGGGRNVLARQRTIEASVAWSHDLLDPLEQRAFRQLSVFAGPFTLEAAEAVVDLDEVTGAVLALVDRSLLALVTGGGPPRYRMLETIRFFARQRLLDAGEAGSCRDRHLQWYRSVVEHHGARFEGRDARSAVEAIDRDLAEVRGALEWAADQDRADDVLAMTATLGWYWIWKGITGEALSWIERAEALPSDPSPGTGAMAAWVAFLLSVHHRAGEQAERRGEAALAAARRSGDEGLEGRTLVHLGAHRSFRHGSASRPMIAEGIALCERAGDGFWAAMGEANLALCLQFGGRHGLALEHLDRAAAAASRLQSPQLWSEVIARRAFADFALGDLHAVTRAAARARDLAVGLTERDMLAVPLTFDAIVQVMRGDAEGPLAALEQLHGEYIRDQEYQHLAGITAACAVACIALDQIDEARALLDAKWGFPELQAALFFRLWFRHIMALAAWAEGDPSDARRLAEELLADAEASDDPAAAARARLLLGAIARGEAEHRTGEAHLHAALESFATLGHRQEQADALEELAGVELDHGRPEAAALLLGAAARERDEMGVVHRPGRQRSYEAVIAGVAAALDPAALDTAWQRGAQMSLADAVDHARRGRGERVRPTFGWDSLTATEAKVADLAAEGHTNVQIAEALLMGRETAKTHMSNVLRKLGLDNRTQLARDRSRRVSPR